MDEVRCFRLVEPAAVPLRKVYPNHQMQTISGTPKYAKITGVSFLHFSHAGARDKTSFESCTTVKHDNNWCVLCSWHHHAYIIKPEKPFDVRRQSRRYALPCRDPVSTSQSEGFIVFSEILSKQRQDVHQSTRPWHFMCGALGATNVPPRERCATAAHCEPLLAALAVMIELHKYRRAMRLHRYPPTQSC